MALNRITVDSIAANAVTNVGIANGTIVSVDLADGSVTTTKIDTGAVTGDKLGATSINANNIVNASITGDKIGVGQITANLFASGAVSITSILNGNSNVTIASANSDVSIFTAGTEAMRIDSGQRTKFPTTIGVGGATPSTSGSGISFPASASASTDANTLDDYEEGTWTPTLKTTSTNFSSITYSGQLGDYVKVGGFIYLQFFVQIASVSGGAGNVVLTGLPFVSSGAGRPNSGGPLILVDNWSTNNPYSVDASGASSLDYNIQYRATSNGPTAGLPVAAATATAYMRGTILIKL